MDVKHALRTRSALTLWGLVPVLALLLCCNARAADALLNAQQAAEAGNTDFYSRFLMFLQPIKGAVLLLAEHVAVTTLYVSISIIVLSLIEGFINRTAKQVTGKIASSNAIKKIGTFQSLALSVARYAVGLAAAMYILVLWGIPPEALAVGTAVIGGAVGFGSQGFVQDMITGFSILFEDQIHVGDYVKIGDFVGTVEDVGLRVLKIRSAEGNLHTLFNRTIVSVTNLVPPGSTEPAQDPTKDPEIPKDKI